MKPKGVREDDWHEKDCIGCGKHVEGMYDKFIWDKELKKWQFISKLGVDICPKCYPIYKNLIFVIKKQIRKDFQEARADMTFRFNENIKDYW